MILIFALSISTQPLSKNTNPYTKLVENDYRNARLRTLQESQHPQWLLNVSFCSPVSARSLWLCPCPVSCDDTDFKVHQDASGKRKKTNRYFR